MSTRQIHTSASSLRGNERKYLNDCIDNNWITMGRYVERFERGLRDLTGAKHVLACSSGTAALHLAMIAAEAGPLYPVLVPALTYVATANAARYCNAPVVFCDVDPDTWMMTAATAREALCASYSSLVPGPIVIYAPVDLYTGAADLRAIRNTAYTSYSFIVEDASHMPGKFSEVADIATFSFYGSKIIACGEGGAVVTNNDDLADTMRLYRGQGARTPGVYHHDVVGYNYRMTDMQAAVGCAQLERFEEMMSHRSCLLTRYLELLTPRLGTQGGADGAAWSMPVLLPSLVDRRKITDGLKAVGVETRPFFEPLPYLPPYRSSFSPPIPVAADLAQRGLLLPLHCEMTDEDVHYVCDHLVNILDQVGA